MSGLSPRHTEGVLRNAWSTRIDDYCIAVAWGVDGRSVFVADTAGGVFGLDGRTGRHQWSRLSAHAGGIMAMAHHPVEARLATSGQDGRVAIWDTRTGELQRALEIDARWVEHVAWSPRGDWLAAASGRRIIVWSNAGERVWTSEPHPSTVSAIAWAKKDQLLSTCYGRVAFWKVPHGDRVEELTWKGSLVSVELSPDGEIVACGSQDNTVHFWRRATGQDSMMSGYPCKPNALAFDSSGLLLATGGAANVTVWCFAQGGPEGTEPGDLSLHIEPVRCLKFAHRGRLLASGGRDSGVVVWRLDARGHGEAVGVSTAEGPVEQLAWRPDDRVLVAIDGEGGVTAWTVESARSKRARGR